jgi:hypothetical protein
MAMGLNGTGSSGNCTLVLISQLLKSTIGRIIALVPPARLQHLVGRGFQVVDGTHLAIGVEADVERVVQAASWITEPRKGDDYQE